jgi:hypothetical protein
MTSRNEVTIKQNQDYIDSYAKKKDYDVPIYRETKAPVDRTKLI